MRWRITPQSMMRWCDVPELVSGRNGSSARKVEVKSRDSSPELVTVTERNITTDTSTSRYQRSRSATGSRPRSEAQHPRWVSYLFCSTGTSRSDQQRARAVFTTQRQRFQERHRFANRTITSNNGADKTKHGEAYRSLKVVEIARRNGTKRSVPSLDEYKRNGMRAISKQRADLQPNESQQNVKLDSSHAPTSPRIHVRIDNSLSSSRVTDRKDGTLQGF